jgi:hypothetical protein
MLFLESAHKILEDYKMQKIVRILSDIMELTVIYAIKDIII